MAVDRGYDPRLTDFDGSIESLVEMTPVQAEQNRYCTMLVGG